MLSKILDLVKREPARVIALAMALAALAAQFGFHLSDPQFEAVKNVVSILLAFLGAAEGTRPLVSPTSSSSAPPNGGAL